MTLCELHRRKVWFDERTANAICTASFHPTSRFFFSFVLFCICCWVTVAKVIISLMVVSFYLSLRIMIATLSFLLDYEKIQDDDDDSDNSDSDDEKTESPQVVLSRETVYKVRSSDNCLINRNIVLYFNQWLSYIF